MSEDYAAKSAEGKVPKQIRPDQYSKVGKEKATGSGTLGYEAKPNPVLEARKRMMNRGRDDQLPTND